MPDFSHAEHIRKRADFERVYQAGSKFSGRLMIMFTLGPGRWPGPAWHCGHTQDGRGR